MVAHVRLAAIVARLAALAEEQQQLLRELGTADHAAPAADPLLNVQELAARLSVVEGGEVTAGALYKRLERPRWAWLRKLGDQHRQGRRLWWRWSEVEAGIQQQRRST